MEGGQLPVLGQAVSVFLFRLFLHSFDALRKVSDSHHWRFFRSCGDDHRLSLGAFDQEGVVRS